MALIEDFVVALDLAAGNHGLVTRQQLIAEGLSSSSIARLADTRHALESFGPGLYVIPALEDVRFSDMWAALQRTDLERWLNEIVADPLGENSGVLSHHTAAEMYGVPDLPREMHLTVPRRRRLSRMTAHTARLRPEDVVMIEGIPVTSPERTTYDLGRWIMDGEHRSRWVDFAIDEGLLTYSAARELLGPSAADTLMYLPMAA